jgi:hypothetical protein
MTNNNTGIWEKENKESLSLAITIFHLLSPLRTSSLVVTVCVRAAHFCVCSVVLT